MSEALSLFDDDFFYYKFPQPQYLGAKYKHLPWIAAYIPQNIYCVCDAFAGSQSVSYFFKQSGYKVIANDFLSSCNQIGKSLIENKHEKLAKNDLTILFAENSVPDYFNLMQSLYTNLFFEESDAAFLDAFRSNVEKLSPYKQALALAVMNRAMTRKVTMGHFAHTVALKYANDPERVKRNRSLARPVKDIFLDLLPEYNNAVFDNYQSNKSFNEDAIELLPNISSSIDLLYLDPPYCTSHPDYQAFYHLLETFTEYWKDKEFVNAVKCYSPKKKSGFDRKDEILLSFQKLFEAGKDIPYWLISYNDRSYPDENNFLQLIREYKNVSVKSKEYENGVGGKGSVKGSSELLFVCTPKHL